jgi:hypothetical protein
MHPHLMNAINAANREVVQVTANRQRPKLEVCDTTPFKQFVL